jgi:hypothetical protein
MRETRRLLTILSVVAAGAVAAYLIAIGGDDLAPRAGRAAAVGPDATREPARSAAPADEHANASGIVAGVVVFSGGKRPDDPLVTGGEPVGGVTVRFVDEEGRGGPHVLADAGGRFEIGGVPASGGRVEVSGRASSGVAIRTTLSDRVAPGTADLKVFVLPGVAVSGRVFDEFGQAIAGAELRLFRARKSKVPCASGTSGADGSFDLVVDRGKSFYLRAYVNSTDDTGPSHGYVELRKVVPDQPDLRVVLRAGHEIRGMVVCPGGEDVAGIPLIAKPTFPSFAVTALARTGRSGEFRIRGLRRGRYRISLDLERAPDESRVLAGGSAVLPPAKDVRLVLIESGSFSGTLVDAAGQPLPHRRMSFVHLTQRCYAACETSPTGTFRIERLAVGTWRVRAALRRGSRPSYADCGTITTGDENVRVRLPAR